ncbi:hypothetical protein [Candidatus Amarolinea dominans]|uniref:hypothetical protein n=1 Tax=Candidatus Amarolinea dominans TaxID=3140696 RepID=UPI001D28FB83|nr:hypothetical protein [Anaerolineae bacterium]
MTRISSTRNVLTWLGLLLALTIPAWAALLAPGYFFGAHDAHHSVFYLVEFDAAIRDGAWWPRWGPDHAMGYGYPFWVVYAPFAYYVAEAFHLLGLGFTAAVKDTFLLAFLLSAAGMFLLVRRWWGDAAGLIAGLLYTYAPYHLVNIYVRAALAEFWAMVWFPWILLAWERLLEKPGDRRRLALAALSLAALFISHTVAMLFFTPWLVAYLLYRLLLPLARRRLAYLPWRRAAAGERLKSRLVGVPPGVHLRGRDAGSTRRVNPAARRDAWRSDLRAVVRAAQSLLAAGLLAVGLAAIFLFPLLAEQRYIGQAVWVRNSYQVETNLIYFHQLFSTSWGFGYSVAGPDDGMSFQLGLAPLLLAVGGVGYSVRRRGQHRGLLAFFLLTTVIIAGMMLVPAAAVWQWLPLGDLIQFPWRLLTLTALALAIMGGASVQILAVAIGDERRDVDHASAAETNRRPAVFVLALFIIIASAAFLQPQWTPITARDESPLAIMDFEMEHPDMIGVMQGTQQPFEETPLLAQYLAGEPLQKAAIIEGAGTVTMLAHGARSGRLRVDAATPVQLVYYTYNFPGWTLTANGRPLEIITRPPYGLIGFELPAGTHLVTLRMGTTPARRAGDIVSGLSLLIVVLLLWRKRK